LPEQDTELVARNSGERGVHLRVGYGLVGAGANGGVNPLTRERVVDAAVCHYVLAVMLTAGLYESSGDWLYEVGLPGKSGIGGGIVTVAPGKAGVGTFAPLLDEAGNSVKGQLVARDLARSLGLDLLASKPISGLIGP
jgi:glutaminase